MRRNCIQINWRQANASKDPAEEETQVKGVLILSVMCLAVGVGLIFGFCSGTTGFSLGSPIPASSLHIDITTTGVPALAGPSLTLLGAFMLVIAFLIAAIGTFRENEAPLDRREEPFVE